MKHHTGGPIRNRKYFRLYMYTVLITRRKEMVYLMMNSTDFICSYLALDIKDHSDSKRKLSATTTGRIAHTMTFDIPEIAQKGPPCRVLIKITKP